MRPLRLPLLTGCPRPKGSSSSNGRHGARANRSRSCARHSRPATGCTPRC